MEYEFWHKWKAAGEEEQIHNIKNIVEILKNSWRAYNKIENEKERTITVDLSEELHAQQKMFSVLALLQAVLGKVGEKEIDILNLSLLTMDVAFAADDNYSDQTRLDSLPNESFLTACKEKAGEN